MFDSLLVACDKPLIAAVGVAGNKLGLGLSICPGAHEVAALLTRRKMYAVLADDAAGVATKVLQLVKESSSSRNACSLHLPEKAAATYAGRHLWSPNRLLLKLLSAHYVLHAGTC